MQQAIQEAVTYAKLWQRDYLTEMGDEYMARIVAEGIIEINEVDFEAFREASMPVWETYREEFGDEIIDAILALRQ